MPQNNTKNTAFHEAVGVDPSPTVTGGLPDGAANPDRDAGGKDEAVPPASAGRYILGEEIARGGMGEVYRATDTVLNREVAVKVLQAKYGPQSGSARRFADEARITGQLQHPNIPATQYQSDLAYSHNNIGNLLSATGKPAEALASYEKARDILQKLADANPKIPNYRSGLAGSLYDIACLYAITSGKHVDKPEKAKAEADKAMDSLRKAVSAGYKDAAHMKKDTDLDSLRGRDDFQKLMAELEAKAPNVLELAPPPREKK